MTAFLHFMQVFGIIFALVVGLVGILYAFAMIIFLISELLHRYFDEGWFWTISVFLSITVGVFVLTILYFLAN